MRPAIEFDHVSKRYQLGAQQGSIRDVLHGMIRRLGPTWQNPSEPFWALRDVSFKVERGQALGIIGANGAGKTTTLKLLSNITKPTHGNVRIAGRVSSLIELGAGFHPDLTGRENIYLNGAILGMTQREIKRLFETIVDFAEIGPFLDTPVKRFSSGMYARLGFAVAAHVNPDVLLIDEVLSVGDIGFQAKCATRMQQLRRQGTSIVFISHNMHAMSGLCDSCVLLERGQVKFAGPTSEAIQLFQQLMHTRRSPDLDTTPLGRSLDPVVIERVEVLDEGGNPRDEFELGETVVARIHYRANDTIEQPLFSAGLIRADGLHVCSNTAAGQLDVARIHGPGVVELRIPRVPLVPDVYSLVTSICEAQSLRPYAEERLSRFRVVSTERFIDDAYGVFLPDFRWRELTQAPGSHGHHNGVLLGGARGA